MFQCARSFLCSHHFSVNLFFHQLILPVLRRTQFWLSLIFFISLFRFHTDRFLWYHDYGFINSRFNNFLTKEIHRIYLHGQIFFYLMSKWNAIYFHSMRYTSQSVLIHKIKDCPLIFRATRNLSMTNCFCFPLNF